MIRIYSSLPQVDSVEHCSTGSTGIETGVISKKERVMAGLRADPSRSNRLIGAGLSGSPNGFGSP